MSITEDLLLRGDCLIIWQVLHKIATDFFSISSNNNVVQDRYSWYPVVDFVSTTSAKASISKLDRIFSDFGVSEQANSVNGTPFQEVEFEQ